ncbi:sigma 54-interacting transcriptional regulator [Myxococcus sp. K15C18031901]|uniref:sigma 54-interacting transcriptional regulator n=1 Tax=Myxococcus dinghuensis TaxID=2906761 RepID=UPI0020A829CA|nr:sigma 54-interacting transcriptional regulator [Myxococcus dinghuensis]MCP3102116.1 sigma 54-interacting transcriptional regulator [Myxococcus dinghuensis]
MSTSDAEDTLDARSSRPSPAQEEPSAHLLVIEGSTSSLCPLPREGEVLIGRASTADVRVQDASVSRHHARVRMSAGAARISDLDSHNGVRVGGVKVDGAHALRDGDVVTLGDVVLVFHGSTPPERPLLDGDALRRRLSEELERVVDYERSVGVVILELGATPVTVEAVREAASGALRGMDVLAREAPHLFVALLPELFRSELEDAARRLVDALRPLAPDTRAGMALAPQDGLDAEALLSAARTAALCAPAGGLRTSGPLQYRLELGERAVLVADAAMVRTFELLRKLAASTATVLLHGETGSGKENAAWALHHWSPRADKRFIALNCATLQESLAESTLFGHERGAFSGAVTAHAGLFEQAHGGTLFLDEVAELSPSVQAKLLRAVSERSIIRLGDSRERPVDVRIVAATHRVLLDEVKAHRFREDLYYRLSTATAQLPPLRNRPRELPLLARTFLDEARARLGRPPVELSAAAMALLRAHRWPGNVRELKNAMEFCAAVVEGPLVEPSCLPDALRGPRDAPEEEAPPSLPGPTPTREEPGAPPRRRFSRLDEELAALERQRMLEALDETGGVQARAARLIGMPLRTFAEKYKKHGLATRRKAEPEG